MPKASGTVVLDAGHGGHDSGAKGQRGFEKDAALDVVLRAKQLLEQNGYNVRLTRSSDVFVLA
jgi:N-acetylmuramoyl-L-alanine amidase